MKLRSLQVKKSSKQEREQAILLAMVDYFIKFGKPVGSHTLQEVGFPELSSATIRNYFAHLEEDGYLVQLHTSGGRIPTDKAFRLYAQYCVNEKSGKSKHVLDRENPSDMKEIVTFLQKTTDKVSDLSNLATFLSAPRFDQDFVTDCKIIGFDQGHYLVALLTNFGIIHTETLHSSYKLSETTLKKIESYFHFRITSEEGNFNELNPEELEVAHSFYQEAMARYLVSYSNFSQEDLYKSGFSKLLRHIEFQDVKSLTSSLSIFENQQALRALVRECTRSGNMKFWIGSDLAPFLTTPSHCSVITAPYSIGEKTVGAIGVLGPLRIPYRELIDLLSETANSISQTLTSSLYKYKITFRSPTPSVIRLEESKKPYKILAPAKIELLESPERKD